MQRIERLAIITLCLVAATAALANADSAEPRPPGIPAQTFEQMKSLIGTWHGEGRRGPVTVTYSLTGRGSALIETFEDEGPSDGMSSVYHMDGEDLMVTHYCGAGNQPRMKAATFDPGEGLVRFDLMDVTNLSAPSAYHTREVELVLKDENHIEVKFDGEEEGKPFPVSFALTRQ